MSRKSRSFSQLFNYMREGSSRNSEYDFFTQNLYSRNGKNITADFLQNSRRLKNRKNGNYLFHEVISLTKSKQLTLAEEKERLFDIVCEYAKHRCTNNLVTGFLHDEKANNVHFHLMISSNEIGESKNQRLTKYDFNKIKIQTEKYVIDKYPELEQDIIINAKKEKQKAKQSTKGWEVVRKGGRLEKKEKIITTLKSVFADCRSKTEFFNRLSKQNIEMYNRGNTIGFINQTDDKKYRLKTLGLESEFEQVQSMLQTGKADESKSTNANDGQQASNKQTKPTKQAKSSTSTEHNKPPTSEKQQSQYEVDSRKEEIKNSRNRSQDNQKDDSKDFKE